MLRCTVAGLMPLMNSQKYGAAGMEYFAGSRKLFNDITGHGSFYLLRELPQSVAAELLKPALPELLGKQLKTGLWRGKDAERIAYDILAAIKHAGLLDGLMASGGLKSPLDTLAGRRDYHSILIRRELFGALDADDDAAVEGFIGQCRSGRAADGSWGGTVVGTVWHLERLTRLGIPAADADIRMGAAFLLSCFRERLEGIHTSDPYGFAAPAMFTAEDRNAEFEAAERYYPEWIARQVCFRHLAIIQNSVCIRMLIKLGYEGEDQVQRALDNLDDLYRNFGGLCASNIKKPILEGTYKL